MLKQNHSMKQSSTELDGEFENVENVILAVIRLYLSYELNLNKEITNEEILLNISNTKYPLKKIQKCFEYSSLIEFAKHESDEKIFYNLISVAEDLINRK